MQEIEALRILIYECRRERALGVGEAKEDFKMTIREIICPVHIKEPCIN